jgi:hypothetical protein
MLYSTPARLFAWRIKEKEEVKKVELWDCRYCKGKFEEGKDQKYEKMDFFYCSMKCLAAHRSKGFN